MRLDDELLDGPPAPGARVMALARAAEVEAAAARLLVPGQGEALHDLRVALRRLRATLDALEPLLGGAATEKQRRRLRRAAGRTGQALHEPRQTHTIGRGRQRVGVRRTHD